MRRFFTVIVSTAIALFVTGCTTRAFGPAGRADASYQEYIDTVLMSQDGKNVVVVGKEYDYIFSDASDLSRLIKSDVHPYLSAEFGGFSVVPGNRVSGTLKLNLTSTDASVIQKATALGFHSSSTKKLQVQLPLHGIRYRKNPEVKVGESYKLNRSYSVQVFLPKKVDVGETMMTPLKVAGAGAMMLLFGVPLLVMTALTGNDLQ